jgi:hypothetical protein
MGGIWEDRSDVNRGVPCRTALYGAGATCRFSVSGGRGLARAALGVKGSQVRILSSRRPIEARCSWQLSQVSGLFSSHVVAARSI